MKKRYLALAVVLSASGLALELLLTRALSVMYWQSLVYVAITVALLGFGASGTLLAIVPALHKSNMDKTLWRLTFCYAVSALLSLTIVSRIPIDAVDLATTYVSWFKLGTVFLLLSLPFLILGTTINILLTRLSENIGLVYFGNLVGSGLGVLVFFYLLALLGLSKLVLVVVLMSVAILFLFRSAMTRLERAVSCCFACVLILLVVLPEVEMFSFKPCSSKTLARITDAEKYPDAKTEFTKWTAFGRLDVTSSENYVEPGQDGTLVHMKVLTTDGDAFTWLQESIPDLRNLPGHLHGLNFSYLLKDAPSVLCIGVGAGRDVKHALAHGAKRVVGVDINKETIKIVSDRYKEYSGDLEAMGDVEFVASEGRSFVRRSEDKFDVVYMNGVDTFTALSSGAYTMVENYLYTVEAMKDYFNVLEPDGILTISRLAFRTPRETARVFLTVLDALRELGVADPTRHVIVNMDVNWGTVLVKPTQFSDDEIRKLTEVCREPVPATTMFFDSDIETYHHRLVYLPGLENAEITDSLLDNHGRDILNDVPYGDMPNVYAAMANSFRQDMIDEFLAGYPFDIRPVRDLRPFFFHFFRLTDIFKKTEGRMEFAASGGPLGWALMLFLIVFSILSSVVFIALPIVVFHRRKTPTGKSLRHMIFFLSIGFGFMFIEIALIQRFSLFLGHPTASMACVISSILVLSGIGSFVSDKLNVSRRTLILAAAAVVLVSLFAYCAFLQLAFEGLLRVPLALRVIASVLLIAPPAFCMGMFFPTGIKSIKTVSRDIIPWACAANSSASVVASVLAIVLAIQFGFNFVLITAATLYIVASLAIIRS